MSSPAAAPTQQPSSQRLSAADAAFLYFEKPNEPLHVGSCFVYDGHISRAKLVQVLQERLHLLPRYRQKVMFPPLRIAHPTWQDDPTFNIERHIDEVDLPAPGDDRALSEFGGTIYAPPLDRAHPLWKMIILRGRADGTTPIIWKVHHAMVDGVSGVDLMTITHDSSPQSSAPSSPPQPWQPQPLPDMTSQLRDALNDRLTETVRSWTDSVQWLRSSQAAQTLQESSQALLSFMQTLPSLSQPIPTTPFNKTLSSSRQFVWVDFPFADIRAVRASLGGTVNDVVLTIIAGGLGKYLRAQQYSTAKRVLRTMCPVNMRQEDEQGSLGNRVSMLLAPLFIDEQDPLKRYTAHRAAVDQIKKQNQAGFLYDLLNRFGWVPPVWQIIAGQLPAANLMLNTVTTNVPGPQTPLYLAGHELLALRPIGLLSAGIGLFNAIVSYHQTLVIGGTVDPSLVSDPWSYAACLRDSFDELLAATQAKEES